MLVPASTPNSPAMRVQVKARIVSDPANAGQRQVSAFRSWDCETVMFVLFDPLYRVRAAALLPAAVVREHSSHVQFTASERVLASDALLELGEDWTERLQHSTLWKETRAPEKGPADGQRRALPVSLSSNSEDWPSRAA